MSSNTRPLLICFPFAGGTADFYDDLERSCSGKFQFIKLEYSGHGKKMKTPLYRTFEELTADLYPQIVKILNTNPDCDYAMLGYSMGSIAMFDMLIKIISKKEITKLPTRVFISAHRARTIDMPKEKEKENVNAVDAVDAWVKERTLRIGGIDKRLIDNKTFWRLFLPVFKIDYQMIANYDFESINFKTKIPATIFYSETDTPLKEMKLWEKYFTGQVNYHCYEGQHFFIKEHHAEMANVIMKELNVNDKF